MNNLRRFFGASKILFFCVQEEEVEKRKNLKQLVTVFATVMESCMEVSMIIEKCNAFNTIAVNPVWIFTYDGLLEANSTWTWNLTTMTRARIDH